MNEQQRKFVEDLTKAAADEGKVVEAGWQAMLALSGLQECPEIQQQEMRKAFFFGAQHLFASIMMTLDPGREPTDQDIHRIDLIDKELKVFVEEMKKEKRP